ncbi:T3SS effector HopA1 family protein [Variovorax sp. 770b2]|jgi:hypothetical protein|uniref:T3SS effector HopA1 family protein n=1 Tax=Variovorax sp. 770b2 TaxID=1566271 RepID=UPI0008E50612|nr:T3SS effector HopA1 family protein [Variovorax sp. 770b2]SFQ30194.1 hypothetical protein SAMN03159339_6561 [Variovorax sp. 770b2]
MREIVMRCQRCGTNFTLYADAGRGPPWSDHEIREIVRERYPLGQVRCTHRTCNHVQPLSGSLQQVGKLAIVSGIGFPSAEELHLRNLLQEISQLKFALGPVCSEGFLQLLKLVWETYGPTHDVCSHQRVVQLYHLYGNHNNAPSNGSEFFAPMVGRLASDFSTRFTRSAMTGFCVFTPVIPLVTLVTRRIYININPSHCGSAIKGVFKVLQNRTTVHSFKFCDSMQGMSVRSDNLVIYLTGDSEQTQIVAGLGQLLPHCFREQLPRMTLRVAHGVSIGSEPLMVGVNFAASTQNLLALLVVTQQSFGKFRCEVILCALNHSGRQQVMFYRLVRRFFEQAGLDPMKPHE